MAEWIEVSVYVPEFWVENVSYLLRECGASGVAIEEPSLLRDRLGEEPELLPDHLPSPGSPAVIKAYYPREQAPLQKIRDFVNGAGIDGARIETKEVAEEDWAKAWQAYYKPVRVGKRLVIKPAWEKYDGDGDEIIITMDPGMAFGSGTHATTEMCLEMVEQLVKPGDEVVDAGTGSGILSIAAALLGAARVTAVDLDPVAVSAARENARANDVEAIVSVQEGYLLKNINRDADVIAANILAPAIIELAPGAARVLKPGGYLIASGISSQRWPGVREAVENSGFSVEEVWEKKQWVALAAKRAH